MRISTQTIYELGVATINRQQATLVKTQQQVSTGRRILTPADDPVASARALEVSQSESANAQYAVNRQNARSSLGLVEATLASVTNLLQDAKELTVRAGNGVYSDAERGFIATELRGRLEELLGFANSTDAGGQYLFSGYQGTTKPFADTGAGVQYFGDDGQRLAQASVSRQLAVSESGREIFERIPAAGGGYQSVFKTLDELIAVLQTPVTDGASRTALTGGLSSAQTNLSNALDNVLKVRAGVGTRLRELDALDNSGEGLAIQYQQQLSDLRDVDYARAISDLTQQQVYLEAAQKSFVKVQGLSLFDYI